MSDMPTRLKVVFMGSPEFAVPCLKMLQEETELLAVVSAPDKPAGRGKQMAASAVAQYAREHGLPLLQPERLKSPEFIEHLQQLNADLFVVVAFRMLPEVVWNMPPLGTLNVHASLLPQLRGAAPIQWAIAHGLNETGLTTFRLKHEIDTGDVLLQQVVPIDARETGGSLYSKLMNAAPDLLKQTLQGLGRAELQARAQADMLVSIRLEAPKIQRQHAYLTPEMTVAQADRWVRAFDPVPGSALKLVLSNSDTIEVKIKTAKPQGQIPAEGSLVLAFADGNLEVFALQPAGKAAMDAASFLRGLRHAVVRWQPLA
jgi:methionyl-tRNA formyltransferase